MYYDSVFTIFTTEVEKVLVENQDGSQASVSLDLRWRIVLPNIGAPGIPASYGEGSGSNGIPGPNASLIIAIFSIGAALLIFKKKNGIKLEQIKVNEK